MSNGLLSPDDMMMQGVATGGSLLSDDPNFQRMTFLPFGFDRRLSPMERLKNLEFAVPGAVLGAVESAQIPGRVLSGEYGVGGVQNPAFMDAATQFSMDYGMLPAVGGALLAPAAQNTLRMGAGGGTTRNVRNIDELGFFSEAYEQAKQLPMEKGTGQQFRSMLEKRGVKPDEIKFTPGLEGLLAQPRVTKDELVGLLEESRIRPQETVYAAGDGPEFEGMNFPTYADQLDITEAYGRDYLDEMAGMHLQDIPDELLNDVISSNPGKYSDEAVSEARKIIEEGRPTDEIEMDLYNDMVEAAEMREIAYYQENPIYRMRDPDTGYEIIGDEWDGYDILDPEGNSILPELTRVTSLHEATIQAETHAMDQGIIGSGGGRTRFAEYTEPGGSNYREMLLQVPEYEGMTDDFIATGHFDEPNIVVHARTKDRSSGSGTDDVLYVEELQSDWGQRGRDVGFSTKESTARKQEVESSIKPLMDEQMRLSKERDNLIETYAAKIADKEAAKSPLNDEHVFYSRFGSVYRIMPDGSSILVMPRSQVEELLQSGMEQAYPFRPGKETNWESEARPKYEDLTSKIKELSIKIKPMKDELSDLPSGPPQGPLVGTSEKFAEVGIKRLINQAAKEGKRYVTFSPGEVQADRWNNEGLKTFYDKIIPKVGKKVAGRLDKDAFVGSKYFEDATGDVSGDRFTIEITPAMREAIMGGQPLFSAPSLPMSGILSDQQQDRPQQGILY